MQFFKRPPIDSLLPAVLIVLLLLTAVGGGWLFFGGLLQSEIKGVVKVQALDLGNGAKINFTHTDDNEGEDLIIHSDKRIYSGEGSVEAFISLTPLVKQQESIDLQFYFPDHEATIQKLDLYDNGQWHELAIRREAIAQSDELQAAFAKKKAVPAQFISKGQVSFVSKGETVYLRALVTYEAELQGEFWLEAFGSKGSYGLLDPVYVFGPGGGSADQDIDFLHIQFAAADGTNPTATFPAVPKEGNLLIAAAFSRSGTSCTSHSISGSGWTNRICRDTELANASYRRSLSVWSKTAGASEPTGITVSGDTVRLFIREFTAHVPVTWTFLEKADNDNGTTDDATSLSTGTTASVSTGDLLLVTVLGQRLQSTVGLTSLTWTNSVGGGRWSPPLESLNGRYVGTGFGHHTTSGTKESTGTFTADTVDNTGLSAGIMVFKAEASSTTLRPGEIKVRGGVKFRIDFIIRRYWEELLKKNF